VEAFGGKVDIPNGNGPEISPTKSYLGESLDYAVNGRTFTCEYDAILQVTGSPHPEPAPRNSSCKYNAILQVTKAPHPETSIRKRTVQLQRHPAGN